MRLLLSVNTGSSSVRLALHRAQGGAAHTLARVHHGRAAGEPAELLRAFVDEHTADVPALVAHRIVHGGPRYDAPQRIDTEVEAEIERLAAWAPLHHPVALQWIRACRAVFGAALAQVAVFDTAFHATLPPAAAHYALPHELVERHGLRRYGFHGIAHRAMWARWSALRPDLPEGGRLITLQLGSGCSACAIDCGRSIETTMGYSPLEGLMMATRCGDIDAAVVLALQRQAGLSVDAVERLLGEDSGLLGVSGSSGDLRVLLARRDLRAELAIEMFCHRVRKAIGASMAALGGADGIVFGGGVGENAAAVRGRILEGFAWAGLVPDAEANAACVGQEARISHPDSHVQTWVVPVDEAHELARQALSLEPMS